jgi:hypothetical protein
MAIASSTFRQIGISPKVIVPFVLQIVGAVVLYFMGEHEIATGLVAAAVATGVAGYASPPGNVRPDVDLYEDAAA